MEERKYLEDVPREIQNLILDGNKPEALRALMKEARFAESWIAGLEIKRITPLLEILNSSCEKPQDLIEDVAIRKKNKIGCLLLAVGILALGIFVNLFDENDSEKFIIKELGITWETTPYTAARRFGPPEFPSLIVPNAYLGKDALLCVYKYEGRYFELRYGGSGPLAYFGRIITKERVEKLRVNAEASDILWVK